MELKRKYDGPYESNKKTTTTPNKKGSIQCKNCNRAGHRRCNNNMLCYQCCTALTLCPVHKACQTRRRKYAMEKKNTTTTTTTSIQDKKTDDTTATMDHLVCSSFGISGEDINLDTSGEDINLDAFSYFQQYETLFSDDEDSSIPIEKKDVGYGVEPLAKQTEQFPIFFKEDNYVSAPPTMTGLQTPSQVFKMKTLMELLHFMNLHTDMINQIENLLNRMPHLLDLYKKIDTPYQFLSELQQQGHLITSNAPIYNIKI